MRPSWRTKEKEVPGMFTLEKLNQDFGTEAAPRTQTIANDSVEAANCTSLEIAGFLSFVIRVSEVANPSLRSLACEDHVLGTPAEMSYCVGERFRELEEGCFERCSPRGGGRSLECFNSAQYIERLRRNKLKTRRRLGK